MLTGSTSICSVTPRVTPAANSRVDQRRRDTEWSRFGVFGFLRVAPFVKILTIGHWLVADRSDCGDLHPIRRQDQMTNTARRFSALLTPPFRVSSPAVFVKRAVDDKGSEIYSCTALFSGFDVVDGVTSPRTPSSWSERDQAKWNTIVARCNEIAIAAFKKPMRELDRAVYTLPFHRGEEEEHDGYGPGVTYFSMSTKRRPCILARDGLTPLTPYGADPFYAGCYARASVTPFANIRSKTLSIGLNHLQKLGDGARLDGFTSSGTDGVDEFSW